MFMSLCQTATGSCIQVKPESIDAIYVGTTDKEEVTTYIVVGGKTIGVMEHYHDIQTMIEYKLEDIEDLYAWRENIAHE